MLAIGSLQSSQEAADDGSWRAVLPMPRWESKCGIRTESAAAMGYWSEHVPEPAIGETCVLEGGNAFCAAASAVHRSPDSMSRRRGVGWSTTGPRHSQLGRHNRGCLFG
jgi:hypothetical protein